MSTKIDRQERLRAQLLQLLMEEFGDLSEVQLGMVFAQVLGDLRTKGGGTGLKKSPPQPQQPESKQPSATAAPPDKQAPPPEPEIPQKIYQSQSPDGHTLAYELFSTEALDKLRKQIETGGLFVQLDKEAALNSAIDICVMLPVIEEETWFEGRVVVQTPAGTGIDLKPTDESYKARWKVAIEYMEGGHASDLKPSGGPKTRPPRLERRTGIHAGPKSRSGRPNERPITQTQQRPPSGAHRSLTGQAPRPGSDSHHQAPPASRAAPAYQTRPNTGAYPQQRGSGVRMAPHGPLSTEQILAMLPELPSTIEGDLEQRSLVSLMVEASSQQGDAILRIKSEGIDHFLIMQVGCPVELIQSPRNPDMELGPLLVQANKITWEKHKEVERDATEQNIEYSEAIVRQRLMSYQEVLAGLQSRITYASSKLLDLEVGRFSYHPIAQLPHRYSTPPLSLAHIVFKSTYKALIQVMPEDLEHMIHEQLETFPIKITPPPCAAAELQFQKKEKRFYDVILESGHRLRFLLGISNLNRSHTLAMLLTLEQMGFIHFERQKARTEMHTRLIDKVKTKIQILESATYFEVLDIHWTSYTELIQEGYVTQKKLFQEADFPENIRDELRDDLQRIIAALDEAREALFETKKRREYRATIVNGLQVENGISLYLRKGDLAMLRMEAPEARSCFKRVLELDPRHAQARSKLKALTKSKS